MKKTVNKLWNRLGEIKVQCPSCGHKQVARTINSVRCHNCKNAYNIILKNKPSRIIYCPPDKIWILHQIISLELDRKYVGW